MAFTKDGWGICKYCQKGACQLFQCIYCGIIACKDCFKDDVCPVCGKK